MADIELVIKIPNAVYRDIINAHRESGGFWADNLFGTLCKCVSNGIPLPKGHGRLIDVNDIRVIELEDSLHIVRHEKGDEIDVYIDAPTIIEADTESEEV